MLDKENDILLINNPNSSSFKLLISNKSQLIISDIELDKDSKKIKQEKNINSLILNFPDDILSIHHLSSINKILISCISNKTLYLIEEKIIFGDKKSISEFNIEKDSLIFQNNKKMTSIISYQENKDKYFLIISDKFGEISMKPINKNETKESFAKEIKIVTGHCDTINYLKLSFNKKILLSSDNFGKIKIYNFPNIFNVLSVILYHEDEVLYTNFGGDSDKCLFVINKAGNIDIWSIYDFINKNQINMDFLKNEKIIEVKTLNKNEYVIIKTDKKIYVVKIFDDEYKAEKIKELDIIKENDDKEKIENKFFDFNGIIYMIEINLDKNKINAINNIS